MFWERNWFFGREGEGPLEEWEKRMVDKKLFNFSYRDSNLKQGEGTVILRSAFYLFPEDQKVSREKIKRFCYLRRERQPPRVAFCG